MRGTPSRNERYRRTGPEPMQSRTDSGCDRRWSYLKACRRNGRVSTSQFLPTFQPDRNRSFDRYANGEDPAVITITQMRDAALVMRRSSPGSESPVRLPLNQATQRRPGRSEQRTAFTLQQSGKNFPRQGWIRRMLWRCRNQEKLWVCACPFRNCHWRGAGYWTARMHAQCRASGGLVTGPSSINVRRIMLRRCWHGNAASPVSVLRRVRHFATMSADA